MPMRVAAWGSVSSEAVAEKYFCAALSSPKAFSPKETVLR